MMNFPVALRPRLRLHQAMAPLVVLILSAAVAVSLSAWSLSGTILAIVLGAVAVWVAFTLPQVARLATQLADLRWWHALWLLILLSGLVLRVRTTVAAADNPLDVASAYRIGLVILVGLGILAIMATRKLGVISSMTRGLFLPLTLFTVGNLLSVLWSVNPAWTFYRSVEYGIDVALIAAIVATVSGIREYKRLFDWTWLLVGLLLLVVLLNVALVPGEAIDRGLGTLSFSVQSVLPAIERNGVGHLSAILAVVAFARLSTGGRDRRAYLLLLTAMVLMLVISQTRSATAGLLISIPLMLFASRRVGWVIAASAVVLVVALSTGLGDPIWDYLVRNQSESQLTTLSGRTDYWSYAWEKLGERPLTGYGAFAGGRFEVAQAVGDPTLSSTHGSIPEVLIGTSIWGVVPIIAVVVGAWFYLGRAIFGFLASGSRLTEEWALAVEALGVLAFITVRSFFTVTIIWHPALEFLLVLGYIELLRRKTPDINRIRWRKR